MSMICTFVFAGTARFSPDRLEAMPFEEVEPSRSTYEEGPSASLPIEGRNRFSSSEGEEKPRTVESNSPRSFNKQQEAYEFHTRAVSDGPGSEDESFPRQRHRDAFRKRRLLRRGHVSPRRQL